MSIVVSTAVLAQQGWILYLLPTGAGTPEKINCKTSEGSRRRGLLQALILSRRMEVASMSVRWQAFA